MEASLRGRALLSRSEKVVGRRVPKEARSVVGKVALHRNTEFAPRTAEHTMVARAAGPGWWEEGQLRSWGE